MAGIMPDAQQRILVEAIKSAPSGILTHCTSIKTTYGVYEHSAHEPHTPQKLSELGGWKER